MWCVGVKLSLHNRTHALNRRAYHITTIDLRGVYNGPGRWIHNRAFRAEYHLTFWCNIHAVFCWTDWFDIAAYGLWFNLKRCWTIDKRRACSTIVITNLDRRHVIHHAQIGDVVIRGVLDSNQELQLFTGFVFGLNVCFGGNKIGIHRQHNRRWILRNTVVSDGCSVTDLTNRGGTDQCFHTEGHGTLRRNIHGCINIVAQLERFWCHHRTFIRCFVCHFPQHKRRLFITTGGVNIDVADDVFQFNTRSKRQWRVTHRNVVVDQLRHFIGWRVYRFVDGYRREDRCTDCTFFCCIPFKRCTRGIGDVTRRIGYRCRLNGINDRIFRSDIQRLFQIFTCCWCWYWRFTRCWDRWNLDRTWVKRFSCGTASKRCFNRLQCIFNFNGFCPT